jgi:hypothetical protein
MLLHRGLPAYNLRDPLIILGFYLLFEALMWLGIHIASEQQVQWNSSLIRNLNTAFNSLARHRFLAVLGIFLLMFLGRLALLPIVHVPSPKITDEFSQLLAADTFAHWRVTNPTHPMWLYFETFMQNQKPSYQSMYPPANGLFLALGQILTGQPWFGVLFAVAAAAAAVCWMLQGWVPPRWALWGGLVFVLYAARNALTEYYLVEGVTILGGALVLGAVPRIVRRRKYASAVWLGIGLALLVTSRPYEGAFLAAGLGFGGIYWAYRAGIKAGALFWRVAFPVALILLPVFLGVGYLNWRSTGSALLAPYQVNLAQQHVTRPLVWQKPVMPPPKYDHVEMASFYREWEVNWWQSIGKFPRGIALFLITKAQVMYCAILWPLAVVLAIGCYRLFKNRELFFLPLAFGIYLLGLTLETYQLLPWYVGPARGLVILLAVYGVRYIGVWKRKSHHGLRISRAAMVLIPTAFVVYILVNSVLSWGEIRRQYPERYYTAREQLLKGLEALPGKQLVIVRYSPSHIPFEEWVQNRADIDSSKVVWARYVADRGDSDLLQYFKDRTVWLVEPDGGDLKITSDCASKPEGAVPQVGGFRVTCCQQPCEGLGD